MKKLFLTLIFISTVFTADDLLSIYNEALERDPEFNSKKADLKISKEFRNQSISALLPRLNLSASTNWNEYYQERILQNDYNTFSYNLIITNHSSGLIPGLLHGKRKRTIVQLKLNLPINNRI